MDTILRYKARSDEWLLGELGQEQSRLMLLPPELRLVVFIELFWCWPVRITTYGIRVGNIANDPAPTLRLVSRALCFEVSKFVNTYFKLECVGAMRLQLYQEPIQLSCFAAVKHITIAAQAAFGEFNTELRVKDFPLLQLLTLHSRIRGLEIPINEGFLSVPVKRGDYRFWESSAGRNAIIETVKEKFEQVSWLKNIFENMEYQYTQYMEGQQSRLLKVQIMSRCGTDVVVDPQTQARKYFFHVVSLHVP